MEFQLFFSQQDLIIKILFFIGGMGFGIAIVGASELLFGESMKKQDKKFEQETNNE